MIIIVVMIIKKDEKKEEMVDFFFYSTEMIISPLLYFLIYSDQNLPYLIPLLNPSSLHTIIESAN